MALIRTIGAGADILKSIPAGQAIKTGTTTPVSSPFTFSAGYVSLIINCKGKNTFTFDSANPATSIFACGTGVKSDGTMVAFTNFDPSTNKSPGTSEDVSDYDYVFFSGYNYGGSTASTSYSLT